MVELHEVITENQKLNKEMTNYTDKIEKNASKSEGLYYKFGLEITNNQNLHVDYA